MKAKTAWEIAPWYRSDFTIYGREDPTDGDPGKEGTDDGNEDDPDDEADEEDDGDEDEGEKPSARDTAALRKALREERAARKAAEKREAARVKQEARAKKAEDSELGTLKEEHKETTTKLERLAAGYLTTSLNSAIEKQARELKFRDPSDATALISRDDLDFEQDEDDPSKVEIDGDVLKDALKKLARAKPHLIASGTDDDEPSGSPGIGRRKKRGDGEKSVDDWRAAGYPAL